MPTADELIKVDLLTAGSCRLKGDAASLLLGDLRARWPNVADIRAGEVWDHKGVEYDAVLVRTASMTPAEIYLAASRAAHELVVLRDA